MSIISPLPLEERSVCFCLFFRIPSPSRSTSPVYILIVSSNLLPPGGNQHGSFTLSQLVSTTVCSWGGNTVLGGKHRPQDTTPHQCLPVVATIMGRFVEVWSSGIVEAYETHLLWAASCLGYIGFNRSGEFTQPKPSVRPTILSSDIAVDSHMILPCCRCY